MTDKNDDPFRDESAADVRIIEPDYALKKIIGEDVDIKKIFSPENIEKAQEVIHRHKDSFLEWVMQDIAALEHSYRKASANLSACEPHVQKLARTAFVIKSQAGTFGFELGSRIAKSLDDFCTRHFKPLTDHMITIRKHIDTLTIIFTKNIAGDGGAIGNELADNLSKLVEKCKKN